MSRSVTASLGLMLASSALAPVAATAQQPIYPVVVEQNDDPLLANLNIPNNAADVGMWSGVVDWPIVAIHSTLLPDGRILTFGAPPGAAVQDGRTLVFWDPRKGLNKDAFLTLPNAQNVDSFCASATLLSDGRLLTSGGATFASGYSSHESMLMDWRTSSAVRDADLTAPRWYATMTKLADGRAVITGGGVPYANGDPNRDEAGNDISSTPEVYTPGEGWRSLVGAYSTDAFGAKNTRWWYPRQWVSPTGSLFGISTEKVWEMHTEGDGSIRTLGTFKTPADKTTRPNVGPTSTAVMYDTSKIIQVGGNGYYNGYDSPSSAAASVFDISGIASGRINVRNTASMKNARQWANATVLPTGKVLVTGGSRYADQAGNNAVLEPEAWDPATGAWTTYAPATNYRGYHSTATLLQNGAVLTAGGGVPGPVDNLNAQVFYPPYLFRRATRWSASTLAPRPRIVSLSSNASGYNTFVDVQLATGDTVSEVSLIAAASVTHSFDSNQRRMKLSFTRNNNGITITTPASANLAPPGYYQLSVVNTAGVPSVSTLISLGAAAPGKPTGVIAQQPRQLVANSSIKFEASTWPGYLMRHQNFQGFIAKIDVNSSAADKRSASFIVRQGRGNAACYSFESPDWPGYYLEHENFRLKLKNGNSDADARAATFCARAPLNGSNDADDLSLEAMDWPGYYLRHRNFEMWLLQHDGSAAAAGDATFHAGSAGLVPSTEVSLVPATWPAYRVRHQNFKALLLQTNQNSPANERADATWFVRPGLNDTTCVSLEAKSWPGYFLRHQNFQLNLVKDDGSAIGARDATFCPRPAKNGSPDMGVVTLEAQSWPGYFVRHRNFELALLKDDATEQAKADTSFIVKPGM